MDGTSEGPVPSREGGTGAERSSREGTGAERSSCPGAGPGRGTPNGTSPATVAAAEGLTCLGEIGLVPPPPPGRVTRFSRRIVLLGAGGRETGGRATLPVPTERPAAASRLGWQTDERGRPLL